MGQTIPSGWGDLTAFCKLCCIANKSLWPSALGIGAEAYSNVQYSIIFAAVNCHYLYACHFISLAYKVVYAKIRGISRVRRYAPNSIHPCRISVVTAAEALIVHPAACGCHMW